MNYLAISGIFAFISSLFCSIIVITQRPVNLLKVTWSLFSAFIALWGIGLYEAFSSSNYENSLFWARALNLSAILIPIFFVHFSALLTGKFYKKKHEIVFYYLVIFIYWGIVILFPQFFIPSLSPKFNFIYYPNASYLYYLFPILFSYLSFCGMYILLSEYNNVSDVRKRQFKYILIGILIAYLGGGTTFFGVLNIPIYPFGTMLVPIYVIMVTYAMVRYRLMGFSIAITRAGTFIIVYTLVLGIPFGLGFHLLGVGKWLFPMSLMVIFATSGPYLYMYIQKKAEKRLLFEQTQYQNTLRKASLGMGRIKDLNRLLSLIVHIVTKTVKIENGSIYLLHEASNKYTLRAIKGRVLNDESESIINEDEPLIKYLKKIKEPIVQEEVLQQAKDYKNGELEDVGNFLKRLDAAVAIPSFIEHRLIAIIFLGKKKDGKLYSHDDLVVFSILSNQAALAIENAQFVEDTKKTHEQLFKAEKMATIGTMADGLSHQINNRLHAMGFIAGDALDTIKMKKANKLPKKQSDNFIDGIEHALERLVDNVKRGGEVVEGLLRYTRKGEEGYSPIDINDLITASFEMVQYKIKINMLDVIKNIDKSLPKVKGNFTQLQEVFFNLIDNSYDAIVQRKDELKEDNFRGKIKFTAIKKGKNIEIIVVDNGIGVREEDSSKLFTPFFTTKLSSKKGTGLGLYVIRQIIEENHNGRVIFKSEYGKGSQMNITLPLSKEEQYNKIIKQ